VLRWAATGRRYFSRTIGLGVVKPASRGAIEEILDGYDRAGITMFLVQSLPHCRPAEYERWLREFGLEPFDAQDRVVRDCGPLTVAPTLVGDRELTVERVKHTSCGEWVEFIERVYRLETGPWLARLIDRPGWHQYVAREGGEIVAARGMHIGPDGTAWLGMDGPVPGITTDDYEPDAALCTFIVSDGLVRGARSFIADIEASSAEQATLPTRASRGLGSRGHTSAGTGRGADARIDLDRQCGASSHNRLDRFLEFPALVDISSGCLTGRAA
jgi:hypothetical protein